MPVRRDPSDPLVRVARSLTDAQHEAAHVVVGVALGLRLRRVWLGVEKIGRSIYLGCSEWEPTPWPREADLIMSAAGVAWERHCGDVAHAHGDLACLRRAGVRGNARIRVLETAAWALLESRPAIHTRVTRALLDRDLTGKDVARIARGERLDPE